jgi:DNA-binding Xre family transcriptional regulator
MPYIGVDIQLNKEQMMTISDRLRAAIQAQDVTLYRIAKDSDVDWGTLQRFLDGTRPNIRIETVEKLCDYLGLELQPKKNLRKKK